MRIREHAIQETRSIVTDAVCALLKRFVIVLNWLHDNLTKGGLEIVLHEPHHVPEGAVFGCAARAQALPYVKNFVRVVLLREDAQNHTMHVVERMSARIRRRMCELTGGEVERELALVTIALRTVCAHIDLETNWAISRVRAHRAPAFGVCFDGFEALLARTLVTLGALVDNRLLDGQRVATNGHEFVRSIGKMRLSIPQFIWQFVKLREIWKFFDQL